MALLVAALDPLPLVNPFIGTSGTQQGGPIDTFPGADVPFGMVQWSPDTPSQNAGGGYEYGDHEITGFSLTHLSGPGCNVFGDFAFLPVLGTVSDPTHATVPFSHTNESASAGRYMVKLDNGVSVELTVTPHTGLGSFTFPASTAATLLINASSDQAGVSDADVQIVGNEEVTGSARSGSFCGMPDVFRVYFAAVFNRPFSSYGTWRGASVTQGSRGSKGAGSGAWVSFDTSGDPVVKVKVSISYVSVAGALANLHAENNGWDLGAIESAAARLWRDVLDRIAISGGTPQEQTVFYTALYHAMLHPNVFSDADGRYRGFDGKVHRVRAGHQEYANYSDWDIYRSEMPLIAFLDPDRANDMVQSLLDAATQGGLLPRWALVNGPTSVMGGDSVDALIAGAYAFGARGFDLHLAVAAMVHGASDLDAPSEDGWYVERPELREYLHRGYIVNTHTTSVAPVPNGASETLEYSFDDFSIAQLARAAGDRGVHRTFMRRASNWENIFDTSTGYIAPRDADGAFMATPITDAGQSGFQEGNAAQYSWNVPQDLRDLVAAMGGPAVVVPRLDTYFSQLNAGQNEPYAWLGNEPSLGGPWVYLSAGAPWRTQAVMRQALTTLYFDSPVGLPGNDDLGEMSAWYVWSAIGLYPQNPAMRFVDIGSPLFNHIVVKAPHGPTITVDAPSAADDAPYVQSLSVNGTATQKTWLALPMHGNVELAFALGATPNKSWGSAPDDAPPSFAAGSPTFPSSSAVGLALGAVSSQQLSFTLSNPVGSAPAHVTWAVTHPYTLRAVPASGSVSLSAGQSTTVSVALEASPGNAAHFETVRVDATSNGVHLQHVTGAVRIGDPNAPVRLAYLENIYDNSVTPIDLATDAMLPKIAVGTSPRDGAFGADGMLYICDRDGATITVIDPNKLVVVKTIKVGQSPEGMVAAPDGMLWFVNGDDGTLQAIDPKTETVNPPIPIGGELGGIAIVGTTAYVTVSSLNEVVPVNLQTHRLGTPIAVGMTPEGIAASLDGRRLYVVDRGSNDVTPIDVASAAALAPIHVGVAPMNVAIAPDDRTAYVANYGTNTVTPIDLVSEKAEPPIVVGGSPYGIVADEDGSTIWVVNHQDNDLVRIDAKTKRAGKPIVDLNGPTTIILPPGS